MAALRYLLDTHYLLWFQGNNAKIPSAIMDVLQNPVNTILFSQVSLFEISIKQTLGKLPEFKSSVDEIYHQAIKDGFTFLALQNHHLYRYPNIPLFEQHKDPFDRLIIAAAYEENASIITADKNFRLYSDIVELL